MRKKDQFFKTIILAMQGSWLTQHHYSWKVVESPCMDDAPGQVTKFEDMEDHHGTMRWKCRSEILSNRSMYLWGLHALNTEHLLVAKAIALMQENVLIGAVGFGETVSEETGTQALLADWGLLIKMQVPEALAHSPAFGNTVLVRTNALRPMLKAAGALNSDWLPDPKRAAFLDGCLTTLCEIQGFAVVPDIGED